MQKKLDDLFGSHHGLDKKSVEFLINALEKNNLPGFDYIEFKQSIGALSKMDMNEEMSIRSAFATAATVGLTKTKLVESAAHYAKVIAKEKDKFDAALLKRMEQKVGGKMKEVEKLKAQIIKHQEKIKQLEEQIAKFQHTVDTADEKINAEKAKIGDTQSNFERTHQSILNQIQTDIENFKKHL